MAVNAFLPLKIVTVLGKEACQKKYKIALADSMESQVEYSPWT